MKKKEKNLSSEELLSEEELELLRASKEADKDRTLPNYDQSDKAKLFRYLKKNKLTAAICLVLAICIVTVCVLSAAYMRRRADALPNKNDFTFIIGGEIYTEKYADAVIDGKLYIDMLLIADYTDMTVSGSDTSVKFTADSDNYLRFENGSSNAVINGAMVELGGAATVNRDECLIPYDFITKAVGNGLRFKLDTETNTVNIDRRMYATDDDDVFIPVEILFYTDAFTVLMGIVQPTGGYSYIYSIDVTPFLSSIDPRDADEYLLLANKENPLNSDYVPTGLSALQCKTADSRTMYLKSDAAIALGAMMTAMYSEMPSTSNTSVTSAYRSYERQEELFERYVQDHKSGGMSEEEAIQAALAYSARPGTSEHQTGLCVDLITSNMNDLDESFEQTDAFRWLSVNAHKYGFILRYPKDKTDVTGYKYEPWHYRFVGRTAAAEIYNSSLCLEEYLELN